MARKRPTASDVTPPLSTSPAGAGAHERADAPDVPSEELTRIVNRAAELGFSPERVATALGIWPHALASLDRATSPAGRRFTEDPPAGAQPRR